MTVSLRDVLEAESVIRPHIRTTPAMEVDPADFGLDWGGRLTLKLECLQHAGSFKPRGAFATLLAPARETGPVVAVSGGNHGAAVGHVAKALGLDATIFVPEYAPKAKMELIRSFGADLRVVGATIAETFGAYEAFIAETGARGPVGTLDTMSSRIVITGAASGMGRHFALTLAHRIHVLETGRIATSGTARELRNDPAIAEAYFGG